MANPKVKWGIWCDPTPRTRRWYGRWADAGMTYSSKKKAQKAVNGRDKWCWDFWTFSVKKFVEQDQ